MGKQSLIKEVRKACRSKDGIPKSLLKRLESQGYKIWIGENTKVTITK